MNPYRYYDHGWEAAARGEPEQKAAHRDWRDGWRDFQDASDYEKHRARQEAKQKEQA